MGFATTRDQRRALSRANAQQPAVLREVPFEDWPESMKDHPERPQHVFRSRDFLVQLFTQERPTVLARISVNRTTVKGDRWSEDITWDELHRIKMEVGFAFHDAVEVYPSAFDVVNVANMRHLWVMREKLPFAWRATP